MPGGYRAPQAFGRGHAHCHRGRQAGPHPAWADDLKEERSHSVSLSADLYHTFGRVQTNLLVEGFYTRLDDVFALRDIEDTGRRRQNQGALQRFGRHGEGP